METIKVVGLPPMWGVSSPSSFAVKLETWLRMEGIPYERKALTKPPQSKTGKIPYIERADGSLLADSSIIIETLADELGIDLDHAQSAEQVARAHVIRRTVEESLYFSLAWERWMDDRHWSIIRDDYYRKLPSGIRHAFAGLVRRKLRRDWLGQGIGRHDWKDIVALGTADIQAVSTLLGGDEYFAGERPGVVDASVYGSIAVTLAFPEETPLQRAMRACPNLIDFHDRMRAAYWSWGTAHGRDGRVAG